jgi:small GTP-binding protein
MMSPGMESTGNRVVKIIMVGAPRAGKSCLMNKYNDIEFDSAYNPTVAGDFTAKEIEIDNTNISAQIWDVGGSGVLGKSFLRGTHGVLLVADMTSPQSLKVLNGIYENVKRLVGFADDSFPCVVVANKLDLLVKDDVENGKVNLESLRLWATARRADGDSPISFFEVSAKEGTNVNIMFESIFRMALTKPGKILTPNSQMESPAPSSSPVHTPGMGNNLLAHDAPHRTELTEAEGVDTGSEGDTTSVRKEGQDDPYDESEEEQAIAKVVIAGASSVGKTFILKRFVGDDREHNMNKYEPTIGADLRIVDMPVKDRTLTLQIWDTSGNPKMLAMGRSIYR